MSEYFSEYIAEAHKINTLIERRSVVRLQLLETPSDSPDFDRLIQEAARLSQIIGGKNE